MWPIHAFMSCSDKWKLLLEQIAAFPPTCEHPIQIGMSIFMQTAPGNPDRMEILVYI